MTEEQLLTLKEEDEEWASEGYGIRRTSVTMGLNRYKTIICMKVE